MRTQLDCVESYYIDVLEYQLHSLSKFVESNSARLRRSRSRKFRRIEHVQIKRKVDVLALQSLDDAIESVERKFMSLDTFLSPLEFLSVSGTYTELIYPVISNYLPASAHYRSVRKFSSEIVVS